VEGLNNVNLLQKNGANYIAPSWSSRVIQPLQQMIELYAESNDLDKLLERKIDMNHQLAQLNCSFDYDDIVSRQICLGNWKSFSSFLIGERNKKSKLKKFVKLFLFLL